jgi:hypothetical protein
VVVNLLLLLIATDHSSSVMLTSAVMLVILLGRRLLFLIYLSISISVNIFTVMVVVMEFTPCVAGDTLALRDVALLGLPL